MARQERLWLGAGVLAVSAAALVSLWALCWAVTWMNVALDAVLELEEDSHHD